MKFYDNKLEQEYKRNVTNYDSKRKLLKDYETGDIYSFDGESILFNGPVKYLKL